MLIPGKMESPLTRGRGLKLISDSDKCIDIGVAPHAGAWIETLLYLNAISGIRVAPHAGAWIETISIAHVNMGNNVAPHAGAWIETSQLSELVNTYRSRPSRGGVD